ncbi:MAG: membrane protein insertase YidC [Candidatus Liptonbacteria bacterium]|nr:membrane protein insertase YidC [Candidatus Liptonbacteria bacterium]
MKAIFSTLLFQPLFNILIFFYQTIAFHDFGLAIIFLTLLIRLILFPVFQKSTRHQRVMQELQPKLKKVQEEHKKDRTKQAAAMMAVYKDHNVSPFSGFLLLLVQIPVLIALYLVLRQSLSAESLKGLYSFISSPQKLNYSFLGLINLANRSIVVVSLAVITQYFQAKLSLPKIEKGRVLSQTEKMGRQMAYFGPILTAVIFFNFPAALGLYWLITSLFSIFQQLIINREFEHGKLAELRKNTD